MNLKEVGARLQMRREELGMSINDVAELVDVHKSTISRYENNKIVTPKIAVLKSIAQSLNVSYRWLTEGIGPKSQSTDNAALLPLLGEVSAGPGVFAEDNIVDYIRDDSVPQNADDKYVFLQVRGDSMYPEFQNGDFVMVKCTSCVDSGGFAVVIVDDDEAVVKRIEYGKDFFTLHSINPLYPPRKFENEEMERIRIFGSVCGLRRSYK